MTCDHRRAHWPPEHLKVYAEQPTSGNAFFVTVPQAFRLANRHFPATC